VLYSHRAFADVLSRCPENGLSEPPDAQAVSVVLDALNTLAESRLDAFCAELRKEAGGFTVLRPRNRSCDCSAVSGVIHTSPATGHAGETRADVQKEYSAPARECRPDEIRTGTVTYEFCTGTE
jgi:hypothetical protein